MKILICPDSFTGTLSAVQAAEAIADGWRRARPLDEIVTAPMSDGGPGFVEVIRGALGQGSRESLTDVDAAGFDIEAVTVADPLGRSIPALIAWQGATAFVESAHTCGLHLIPPAERDPWRQSSYGLGELIAHACAAGAERIVVGLGGTGTVDAGAGLLAALGAIAWDADGRPTTDHLRAGPAMWRAIAWIDVTPARRLLSGVDVVIASDVDVPLFGPSGAARGFGAQKFTDPASVSEEELLSLESALIDMVDHTRGADEVDDLTTREGAGAAGGIGWALLALGATTAMGIDIVQAVVGFDDLLGGADLVITGEGSLDWQSRRGKVVEGIARRAQEHAVPVVAIAGRVELGSRELGALGIVDAYALSQSAGTLPPDPAVALAGLAEHVAGQWSVD